MKRQPCHWQDCIKVATVELRNLPLVYTGRTFVLDVPLCDDHEHAARTTGHVLLRYDPKEAPRRHRRSLRR